MFLENKVVIGWAIYGFIRVYHEMNVSLFFIIRIKIKPMNALNKKM